MRVDACAKGPILHSSCEPEIDGLVSTVVQSVLVRQESIDPREIDLKSARPRWTDRHV